LANRKIFLKGELGKDSDLLEQILEAAEEEDVSGQILQQAASKKVLQLLKEKFFCSPRRRQTRLIEPRCLLCS
jgi:hypothetical protein